MSYSGEDQIGSLYFYSQSGEKSNVILSTLPKKHWLNGFDQVVGGGFSL
ncbi:hypothetical protein [Streptococcus iniae]|nr:hypothetical protein [Streptococcus iniae]